MLTSSVFSAHTLHAPEPLTDTFAVSVLNSPASYSPLPSTFTC